MSFKLPAFPPEVCHRAWTASIGFVAVTAIAHAALEVSRYRKANVSSDRPDIDCAGARDDDGEYPGMKRVLNDSYSTQYSDTWGLQKLVSSVIHNVVVMRLPPNSDAHPVSLQSLSVLAGEREWELWPTLKIPR